MRSYRGKRGKSWKKIVLCLLLAGVVSFSALFGAVCLGGRDEVHGQPQVMLVLGCQVHDWGPSVLLQDRLREALEYLEDYPDMLVVVSGGQGADEPTSEAAAMAAYLEEHGVSPDQILLEDQASNTYENLLFSMALLESEGYSQEDAVLIVSNGFHLTRVRMLAQRMGYGDVSTLAAPSTHIPSRLKMYIREPLALVKSFLLDC